MKYTGYQPTTLFFFLGFLLAMVTSCTHYDKLPLSGKKLVEVLADLHVAEAALISYEEDKKDSIAARYYRDIAAIHDIDLEDLDTCIAIMRRNPVLMQQVYDQVLLQLEAEKMRR
ncbi:MAG: hypothetical protein RI973_2399 [Bacteroidota bacterium]